MKISFVIGITGASGSGKTTILKEYAEAFAAYRPAVISLDNYYHPIEKQKVDENGVVNFDLPTAFNMEQFFIDFQNLINGIEVVQREYDFNNSNASFQEVVIKPSKLLFIEGLFVLQNQRLKSEIDYHVFVKANEHTSFERRLNRDTIERGITKDMVKYQWLNHVKVANEKYLYPYENEADMVIDNSIHYQHDFQRSIADISSLLEVISDA